MCQFSGKMEKFDFFGPNLSKVNLKLEIHRTSVAMRISILEIPCVPIFRQNRQIDFLSPNLPKNGFWSKNFKNLSLVLKSASLRYYVYQFSDKRDNFEFLDTNLPKNWCWGKNFKNLILDSDLHYIMCANFQSKWTFGFST